MKRLFALFAVAAACLLAACSKPTDIVFGPEPLKQMAEQGDQFRKLPEADRQLLGSYLAVSELGKAFSGFAAAIGARAPQGVPAPVAGRTVGEVLVDARAWKAKAEATAAADKKREQEAAALVAKVEAERKAFADKMASQVTVAFVNKQLRKGDFSDQLVVNFAVENKAAKVISQIKGRLIFSDISGAELGTVKVEFDEKFVPGTPKRTDTGKYWAITGFGDDGIRKAAEMSDYNLRGRFEIDSIAFADGEVLRAPGKQSAE